MAHGTYPPTVHNVVSNTAMAAVFRDRAISAIVPINLENNPLKRVSHETIREACDRIMRLFPEFLFFHRPTVLYATANIHPVLLTAIIALCGLFNPIAGNEWLDKDSVYVRDEIFANYALKKILHPDNFLRNPELFVLQSSMLMSVYKWAKNDSYASWMLHGTAARMLQAFGFCGVKDRGVTGQTLEKEMGIRTFWSCFLVDRMISFGENRTYVFSSSKISKIPLPCDDESFLYMTDKSDVSLLPRLTLESYHRIAETPRSNHSSILLIKVFQIWGEINVWALNGGRRSYLKPPWSDDSIVHSLKKSIDEWWSLVPETFRWSRANFQANTTSGREISLAMMNCVYHLCIMALGRPYSPFLPYNIACPCGPTEEPLLPPPPEKDYWDSLAVEINRSGRTIAEVLLTIEETTTSQKNVSPGGVSHQLSASPFLEFCGFSSATLCLYSSTFKAFDPEKLEGDGDLEQCFIKMLSVLETKMETIEIAKGWVKIIQQLCELYDLVTQDVERVERLRLNRNDFRKLNESIFMINLPNYPTVQESIRRRELQTRRQSDNMGVSGNRAITSFNGSQSFSEYRLAGDLSVPEFHNMLINSEEMTSEFLRAVLADINNEVLS